uniref:Retrovirus-related Pol polyprotein from transposon TNT 1-94-like beta-barrel domain-containing protein n=1 Tax=Peronospora matthiolae TaxID=2874970 RepID=A0AAV1U1V6_9STRA
MTSSKKFKKNYKVFNPVDVNLADDGVVQAIGKGDIVMSMKQPRGTEKGVLTDVWHIQMLSRNLFSVGRFTKDVGPVTFKTNGCFAKTKGVKWKLGAREGKGPFTLCMTPEASNEANALSSNDCKGVPGRISGSFGLVTSATEDLTPSSRKVMEPALTWTR